MILRFPIRNDFECRDGQSIATDYEVEQLPIQSRFAEGAVPRGPKLLALGLLSQPVILGRSSVQLI
jgi:hypothetical protein